MENADRFDLFILVIFESFVKYVSLLIISAVYVWCPAGWLLWRSTDQAKVNSQLSSAFCPLFFNVILWSRNFSSMHKIG